MADQEEVDGQIELLAASRRTLSQYLRQQAQLGEAHAPPAVLTGIHEARENIRRIKGILRAWNVYVADHPNDEDVGQILQLDFVLTDGTRISNPSPADIEYVLNSLQGGADEFAILERRTTQGAGFIQTLSYTKEIPGGSESIGFVIEYQEGSSDRQYTAVEAVGHGYTRQDVISVFQSYANGDDSWKGRFKWEKVTF